MARSKIELEAHALPNTAHPFLYHPLPYSVLSHAPYDGPDTLFAAKTLAREGSKLSATSSLPHDHWGRSMGQAKDPSQPRARNCASAVASEDDEEDGDGDDEAQVRRGRHPAGAQCARISASAVSRQRRRLALVQALRQCALRQQLASRPQHGRQDDVDEAQACTAKRKSASLLETSVEPRKRLKNMGGKPPPRPRQSVDVGPAACDFCQRIFMSRHAVDVHQSRNQVRLARRLVEPRRAKVGVNECLIVILLETEFDYIYHRFFALADMPSQEDDAPGQASLCVGPSACPEDVRSGGE